MLCRSQGTAKVSNVKVLLVHSLLFPSLFDGCQLGTSVCDRLLPVWPLLVDRGHQNYQEDAHSLYREALLTLVVPLTGLERSRAFALEAMYARSLEHGLNSLLDLRQIRPKETLRDRENIRPRTNSNFSMSRFSSLRDTYLKL